MTPRLLQWLFRRGPEAWPIRFDRSEGPICYTTQLLYPEPKLQEVTAELLTSRLDWHWLSERVLDVDPSPAHAQLALPQQRSLTALSASTTQEWIADCTEETIDDTGRSVVAFGVDPGADVTGHRLRSYVDQFLATERGPLRLVVSQLGDSEVDYVFVPQQPGESVATLLAQWRLVESAVVDTRPYRHLNTASLESVAHWKLGPTAK